MIGEVGEHFTITQDHLDNEELELDTVEQYKDDGFNKEFRLYDDDDILYYSGLLFEDAEDEFEPLDWAMNDSGCTRIDYLNEEGEWETL